MAESTDVPSPSRLRVRNRATAWAVSSPKKPSAGIVRYPSSMSRSWMLSTSMPSSPGSTA